MTTVTKAHIERLRERPEDEPDTSAATLLRELDTGQRWEELFDQTTDEQWKTLG